MEHSSIEHAATASATRSNKTGEETGQVKDLVCFLLNGAGRGPSSFLRKRGRSKKRFVSEQTGQVTCSVSSYQTQQVQQKSAYYCRIRPCEICRIPLISGAKHRIDTSFI